MFNLEHDILIDISSFKGGLTFNIDYFTNAIKDITDSLNEGLNCNGTCKDGCGPNYDVYFITDKINNKNTKLVDNISKELNMENLSIYLIEKDYDTIYTYITKFRNIILSSNILSYFAAKQNINKDEDVLILCFEYGKIENEDIEKYKKLDTDLMFENQLFIDGDNYYVENPLISSHFIVYSDLDYLEN